MSFRALCNARVTVARRTGEDTSGDPTYGAQTPIDVRLTKRVIRRASGQGLVSDVVTQLASEEWEFQRTDAIWLPGADTDDAAAAMNPSMTGSASTAGIALYTAEL